MEVYGRGGGPVSWAKTKVNRTRSKGLYSPTRNIYVGTGGVPHTRSSHPPLMDWLATGADVRLKLSQTQLPSISLDFLLCSVRQTFTAKLLFSESCNNSLYFVLDADNLPPDPPSPPLKLTQLSDELFNPKNTRFVNKYSCVYSPTVHFRLPVTNVGAQS